MTRFLLPSSVLRAAAAAGFTTALLCQGALAQTVAVKNAWARATVQGQKASGAFMSLTAASTTRLVAVSTSVAAVAEVHEMRMEGDIMKMAAVPGGLELPAGKTVELKPGGYHLMLMDLKLPLQKDSSIPLTLVFKDAKGVESRLELKVPVGTAAPMAHMHADH
jgi:copper(I)-binding protein